MRGFLSLQIVLLPIALLLGALAAWPVWAHGTLRETSPIFTARGEVEHWATGEERARQCLASSVGLKIVSETDLGDSARGAWFGILRCSQQRIYPRVAAALLLPFLLINLIVLRLRTSRR